MKIYISSIIDRIHKLIVPLTLLATSVFITIMLPLLSYSIIAHFLLYILYLFVYHSKGGLRNKIWSPLKFFIISVTVNCLLIMIIGNLSESGALTIIGYLMGGLPASVIAFTIVYLMYEYFRK